MAGPASSRLEWLEWFEGPKPIPAWQAAMMGMVNDMDRLGCGRVFGSSESDGAYGKVLRVFAGLIKNITAAQLATCSASWKIARYCDWSQLKLPLKYQHCWQMVWSQEEVWRSLVSSALTRPPFIAFPSSDSERLSRSSCIDDVVRLLGIFIQALDAIRGSQQMGVPQNRWLFHGKSCLEMDDVGVPPWLRNHELCPSPKAPN